MASIVRELIFTFQRLSTSANSIVYFVLTLLLGRDFEGRVLERSFSSIFISPFSSSHEIYKIRIFTFVHRDTKKIASSCTGGGIVYDALLLLTMVANMELHYATADSASTILYTFFMRPTFFVILTVPCAVDTTSSLAAKALHGIDSCEYSSLARELENKRACRLNLRESAG